MPLGSCLNGSSTKSGRIIQSIKWNASDTLLTPLLKIHKYIRTDFIDEKNSTEKEANQLYD
jgi:hypothetical protein